MPGGRIKIGPDRKLYYSIGDQGNDQLGNYCVPIESQRLPTQGELQEKNYAAYVGKVLRLNLEARNGVIRDRMVNEIAPMLGHRVEH